MTKLDAGLITSLPASDPGSTAVWGSKRINPRPQFCLCLTWSGFPSNDEEEEEEEEFKQDLIFFFHSFSTNEIEMTRNVWWLLTKVLV